MRLRRLTPAQYDAIPVLYRKGLSSAAIAQRFGIVPRYVQTILSRHGVVPRRKLTDRQRDEVARLYRGGLSSTQLAQRFGIAPTYVMGILIRRGVERRPSSHYHLRHGHARRGAKTKENRTWWSMVARCRYPSYGQSWARYGGRGIKVCRRWERSFAAFLKDVGPAPSRAHSIDRIDPDGDYRPSNVRWATRSEQARNTSTCRRLTYRGERLTIREWAERLGVKRRTLGMRLHYGWSVKRTLTTPVRHRR